MANDNRSKTDRILDLLLDALLERQQSRQSDLSDFQPASKPDPAAVPDGAEQAELMVDEGDTAVDHLDEDQPVGSEMIVDSVDSGEQLPDEQEASPDELAPWIPEKLPPVHLDRMLGRLIGVMALLIIIVNVPFNRFGTSLARAMPDTASLIIRDGLVLKGEGDEIYVLENNQLRWISTLEAFDYYGYRWEQVRLVDEPFLTQFEKGRPIYLLLKCNGSPHVYALENGKKRWIKDIPTFVENGFVWEEIRFVSCGELRNTPDGPPIPPDAGTPRQP